MRYQRPVNWGDRIISLIAVVGAFILGMHVAWTMPRRISEQQAIIEAQHAARP